MSLPQIVLGTHNAKKRHELQALLNPHGSPADFAVKSLADFENPIEVLEDGTTFEQNAARKATEQALHLAQWVIGEDSGLCVDALDGAPGIYSARFSGEHATDTSNNAYLLKQMAGVPDNRRNAHYVCHMALANPHGEIVARCQAECHGRLRTEPAGTGGFGYDPLFELLEYRRTFGELGPEVKSVLSHRARAIRRFLPRLRAVVLQQRQTSGGHKS